MNNIIINEKNRTIEMSKKFAVKACKFGTDEYNALQTARRDYPNYKVVTKAAPKRTDSLKGLTYEFMEKYIKSHDNSEENLKEFYKRIGRDGERLKAESYGEIKKWFVATYPAIANFQTKSQKNAA